MMINLNETIILIVWSVALCWAFYNIGFYVGTTWGMQFTRERAKNYIHKNIHNVNNK